MGNIVFSINKSILCVQGIGRTHHNRGSRGTVLCVTSDWILGSWGGFDTGGTHQSCHHRGRYQGNTYEVTGKLTKLALKSDGPKLGAPLPYEVRA